MLVIVTGDRREFRRVIVVITDCDNLVSCGCSVPNALTRVSECNYGR
jgi:hypothetical protein